MKTTNFFKTLIALFALVAFTACVQDDDYAVPTITEIEPNISATTSFELVQAMYTGTMVEFDEQGDHLILEGYVVSSDQSGNIYKNIYIQDSPENPTYGFRLDVDMTDTYLKYDLGRKVYIDLNGLFLSKENEVLAIGTANGTSLERIPELSVANHIIRSTEVATIVPKPVSIADIQEHTIVNGDPVYTLNTSILVEVQNVQIPISDLGESYANPDNTFSVNRDLISCDDNSTVIFRNSGFANFKGEEMPQGKGSAVAILAQYNDDRQLFIRDTNDLTFNENRCDPLFFDDFENLDAWTTYSVTGSEEWYIDTFNEDDPVARMSGFNSGAQTNEDWLISPAIDLSSATAPVLNFENVKRYSGADLEVFMSTNYAGGDPNLATWTPLTVTLDTNTGSWSSWTDSGDIDVSAAVGGNLFVAFKYTSDTSDAATWQVDAVQVREQ